MPETEKYAPEVYAEKRVQELAFKADADLTTNFATEDRSVAFVNDAVMSRAELEKRKAAGLDVPGLTKPTEKVLQVAEQEFTAIKDDVTKTDDIRAAAEILGKRSTIDKERKVRERLKKPFRFAKSAEMFRSMSLTVKPAPGTAEFAKIERYSAHYEKMVNYLSTRFSSSPGFANRLLSAKEGADKDLAAPVEKKVKYLERV